MKNSVPAMLLIAMLALVSLAVFLDQTPTGEMAWNKAFQGYGECPSDCYDPRLKATCLIWPGTGPWGGYCYGKPQFGLVAKCSCPALEP